MPLWFCKRALGISIIVCLILAVGIALASQSRLSCAVALIFKGELIQRFLQKPGISYVETQFMIRPDFPSDVILELIKSSLKGRIRLAMSKAVIGCLLWVCSAMVQFGLP